MSPPRYTHDIVSNDIITFLLKTFLFIFRLLPFIFIAHFLLYISNKYTLKNQSKLKPYSCIYLPFLLDIGAKAAFDIAV